MGHKFWNQIPFKEANMIVYVI